MNKKKIVALLVAGVMTIGVVGGTLAWFSDTDSVTNVFDTGKINNEDNKNGKGVEIYEEFQSPVDIVPGDTTTKLVQIKNTTSYDSFIRVRFDKLWRDEDRLLEDNIQLNFTDNVVRYDNGKYVYVNGKTDAVKDEEIHGKWIEHTDGYYYYVGRVPGGKYTNTLLASVTLSTDADNDYRNKTFEVKVNAESIQADNNAYESLGLTQSQDGKILELLQKYSVDNDTSLDSGNDNKYNDNVTVTIESVRD